MKNFVFILIITLFIGCCNEKSNDECNQNLENDDISLNYVSESKRNLTNSVIRDGDTNAYNSLDTYFMDEPYTEEFLFYALIMANKYKYPQAYYDVYFYLTVLFTSDMNQIDEETAKMAIKYLLMAADSGHHQALDEVEKFNINSEENAKIQLLRIYAK